MAGAVRDQRIPRNSCEGVKLPRLPHQEQRYLTLAQLQDLADATGPYRLTDTVPDLPQYRQRSRPVRQSSTSSGCSGTRMRP
jgi:hypothetical protein